MELQRRSTRMVQEARRFLGPRARYKRGARAAVPLGKRPRAPHAPVEGGQGDNNDGAMTREIPVQRGKALKRARFGGLQGCL